MCCTNRFGITRNNANGDDPFLRTTNAINNQIVENIMKIDRFQRDATSNIDDGILSCNVKQAIQTYNTIPISLILAGGTALSALLGITGNETVFFRIESVNDCRFVTLRLLEVDNQCLVSTCYSIICDLNCVCCIQCYDAINLDLCSC